MNAAYRKYKKSTRPKQAKTAGQHKKKLRRRRRRIRLLCRAGLAGIFLGVALSLGSSLLSHGFPAKAQISVSEPISAGGSMAEYAIKDQRKTPDEEEAERKLAELAMSDPDIAEIYAHKADYPGELLMALAANQEITGFVKGYFTAGHSATGGITPDEAAQSFPLFMQWDARWGYVPYGGLNIGISGCGPTCLSMVIFALTRNEAATPDALAALSMDNGYYTQGVGTAWSFMTDAVSPYGIHASELGLDEAEIKYYLDQGWPVICAMRPGDFTTAGHFIMLYGYDADGFLVNDPNSRERSSRHWDFETLRRQIKNLWGYHL